MGSAFSKTSAGCFVLGLGFHLGVLVALLVLWVAAGLPLGTHLLKRSERAWLREFLEEDEGLGPVREHTSEALKLDALARRAGTALAVGSEDRKTGVAEVKPEFRAVWDFIGSLRKSEGDGGVRLPPAVREAVETRAEVLQAIEEGLLAGVDVEWKTPLADELTVSWIGFRNVHSLLLVRSLLADQRGALPARDRALEASWRLNEGLWRRSDVVERLLAFSFDADRNALLRSYRAADRAWGARLSGRRPLSALAETYQAEGLKFCRRARSLVGVREIDFLTSGDLPPAGPRGWLFRAATAPYLRLSVAAYSDALREETRRLGEVDPCSLEREPYTEWVKESVPAWNILARVAMPGLVGSWLSGRDAGLDAELTAVVLDARGASAARGERRWESAVCSELDWVARPAGRGRVRVEAEGELPVGREGAWPRMFYALSAR